MAVIVKMADRVPQRSCRTAHRALKLDSIPTSSFSFSPFSGSLAAVQVLFVSSSIVIVVLPGGRKMASQSDEGRQSEKGRAEDGRKHHLSPVHATLLFDHDPTGL